MQTQYFDDVKMQSLAEKIYTAKGCDASDARIIADVLVMSDRLGVVSHGVQRLKMYTDAIDLGRIKPLAQCETVYETPISALIDVHDGIGQTSAVRAMQLAIDKAKASGVGITLLRNGNHIGMVGYYPLMAAREGLFGMAMTNAFATVVPTFGKHPMLGTNPIAYAMPATPHPFLCDMATSVYPVGKIEVYAKTGKTLPEGVVMGSDGVGSTDPNVLLRVRRERTDGGVFPIGGEGETHAGHKGYGMAMLVEIMTAIMACGTTSNHVREAQDQEKVAQSFIAIDYGRMFGNADAIETGLTHFLNELRASAKAQGHDVIYTHGDKAFAHLEEVREKGIRIDEKSLDEIRCVCRSLNIDPAEYLVPKEENR